MARLLPRRFALGRGRSLRSVTGKSERTLPLKVSASSSKPVLPDSTMRTLPECEVNS